MRGVKNSLIKVNNKNIKELLQNIFRIYIINKQIILILILIFILNNQVDNSKYRLPVCHGILDTSDDEEDKDNNKQDPDQIRYEQNLENNIISNQDVKSVLIIEPVEGIQTNYFCVKEEGGKIGRHSSNQILILEESISRHHAEIVYKDKRFFIKDIGSSTGTFIKIKDRTPMEEGMIYEMGTFQYEVIELNYDDQIILLRIVDDVKQDQQKEYRLDLNDTEEQTGYVSIGRKQQNQIYQPDDLHLSNLHAKMFFMNGQFFLEDCASTNGSWLRLSKESELSELREIHNNTIIKIGSTSTYNCKLQHCVEQQQEFTEGCIICEGADKDAVFYPCRHNAACIKCSKTQQVCPICRTKITDIVKIFKA